MIYLVTGGASCGKSKFAEDLAIRLSEPHYYLATMLPFGNESKEKILKHREERKGKNFLTFQCYGNLQCLKFPQRGTVLLECMGNVAANVIFSQNSDKNKAVDEITKGIENIINQSENIVIVSNDIFSDNLAYDAETLDYMKILGLLNQKIGEKADYVIEICYSIPIFIKGDKNCF
ncbi:MAG: bifunctional adenosylcobinamide kinase/adenosylcobinamide-phosphate guanylyltransferase [Oscillospiraceae bacterium]